MIEDDDLMFIGYSEIHAMIAKKPANKDLAQWLSDQVYIAYRIKMDLEELKQEEKLLRSSFKVQLKKIQRRRSEIRERCRHPHVDVYVNASGNRIGYGICYTCGDEHVEVPV